MHNFLVCCLVVIVVWQIVLVDNFVPVVHFVHKLLASLHLLSQLPPVNVTDSCAAAAASYWHCRKDCYQNQWSATSCSPCGDGIIGCVDHITIFFENTVFIVFDGTWEIIYEIFSACRSSLLIIRRNFSACLSILLVINRYFRFYRCYRCFRYVRARLFSQKTKCFYLDCILKSLQADKDWIICELLIGRRVCTFEFTSRKTDACISDRSNVGDAIFIIPKLDRLKNLISR